jgi:hypothetical protein
MTFLAFLTAAAVATSPISADRIKADDKTLSSDAFAGRGPGEDGEIATIDYLATSFAAGLEANTDFGICVIRHARSASPDATT